MSSGIELMIAFGVARRAAVVGQRFHLGRRVHVGDDDGSRILGFPAPKVVRGDRRRERTTGLEVGKQHRLVGGEDRGRLGHEVHAAEQDDVGVGGCGLAGKTEGVADVVGDVLDLGDLVVVGEDHGVALARRAHEGGPTSLPGTGPGSAPRSRSDRPLAHHLSRVGSCGDFVKEIHDVPSNRLTSGYVDWLRVYLVRREQGCPCSFASRRSPARRRRPRRRRAGWRR